MAEAKRYIVALDQGTTSSRALVFDRELNLVGAAQREFTQIYPRPGWVEHDPMEIWATQSATFVEVLARAGIAPAQVAAVGLTNQRETTVVWERETGRPIHNAIVWQCRRTTEICERLRADGLEEHVRARTGLVLDPYFSGTKLAWILDQMSGARDRARAGELLFGTVDTWLAWKLTGGRAHVTDPTNASRTMLYDLHRLAWDETMLEALGIPACMLPEVRPSSGVIADVALGGGAGASMPLAGIAGDQQAALFGQLCFREGRAKNTYGTGCFLLMHTGSRPVRSRGGLLTTVAVGPRGEVAYALEGSVFVGGAVVQWLRDGLGILREAADSGYFASKVSDSAGVYVVPAFVGLGAPHWDAYARGAIVGLTRGAGRNHIIRAALESIAYQSRDVLDAMRADAGIALEDLRVDGGAAANDFLMQFQSDILGARVLRPRMIETTALGAALLAGLAVGFWEGAEALERLLPIEREFEPGMEAGRREELLRGWRRAVGRARGWCAPDAE